MCDPVSAGMMFMSAANMYQQDRQGRAALGAQKEANATALQVADKNAAAMREASAAANGKQPDVAGLQTANEKAASSGTLLTGAQGVDPKALTLGKATLLGG